MHIFTEMDHCALNAERWKNMPFMEQMANVGSEVGRTAKWTDKGKTDLAYSAFCRALDLIDLTLEYGRLVSGDRNSLLRELCRVRECFCDAFTKADTAALSSLDLYFSHFAAYVQIKRDSRR